MTNSVRIIGFGNLDRGDDAAGLLVARRLRELAVESEENCDPLSLIDSWSNDDEIIIIDAVVTGATPGTIRFWQVGSEPLSGFTFETTTHGLGVRQAIELARTLNRLPERIRIYGIEGRLFEIGASPSPKVLNSVENVAQQLARAFANSGS
jgi:hydrogenase maturation protease